MMKPFKVYFGNEFDDWLFEHPDLAAHSALPKAKRPDIAQFTIDAWDGVTESNITNTWRHIGYN